MTLSSAAEDLFWCETFPRIAVRAAEKYPELAADLATYTAEFRRFMDLLKSAVSPVAMISPRIDHLWHELITCTIIYREYCENCAGRFLDHMPRTEWSRVPEDAVWSFFDGYTARHGELPECWYDGIPLVEATQLRQRRIPPAFRWSGHVPQGYQLD
ncbi:MAG TPA: hypothetical protein VFT61_02830 [Sphingomicrobium sp.]|nr:hypothetical protein [Sphingomicrobium sp.]